MSSKKGDGDTALDNRQIHHLGISLSGKISSLSVAKVYSSPPLGNLVPCSGIPGATTGQIALRVGLAITLPLGKQVLFKE